MPELVFLHPPGKPTEVLYEDGIDFAAFGDIEIRRNSHVEPVDGGPLWEIQWYGEFVGMFGERTREDEHGRPFTSHAVALACEKRMLLQHHYKI